MSACRPARCLLSGSALQLPLRPQAAAVPTTRSFTTSAPRPARRRRPHYPSIKAEDLKLLNQAAEAQYPKYDAKESDVLATKYTPGQMAAIKAAESAIDPRDMVTQKRNRADPWKLPYESDLSEVDPVTDQREKLLASDIPGKKTFRKANNAESKAAMARVATEQIAKLYPNGLPEQGTMTPEENQQLEEAIEAAITQAWLDPRTDYYSKNPEVVKALADPRYSLVETDLPRLENRMARQTRRLKTEVREDPRQKQLLQYLRWDKFKLKNIYTKTLVTHTVTNQTRMGKIMSLYYLTIAGNKDGLLGVGEGKSVEPDEGRKQSIMAAIRNMKPIPRYEGRTVYGTLEKKVGATKVQLFSRPPGFGLRTQHLIFEMARLAGLHDLSAKTPRSRNKMNVVKATWEALTSQKLPDEIARGRGKKLVDVRKVYYGGSVH